MKKAFNIVPILAAAALFVACEKDNYPAPNIALTGKIVYQGESIGVEHDQVRVQLWQPGFGKLAAIDAPISQEGNFSALLFNGNYKMAFPRNEGPFMTIVKDAAKKDTIYVDLNGNQELDIEVLPYYMIRNAQFTAGEKKVNGSFKLDKIITDANAKDVERVSLYISRTMFVSRANNIGVTNMVGADIKDFSNIRLSVNVPATITPAQSHVYARIGVKIAGVEDMLFSEIQKLTY